MSIRKRVRAKEAAGAAVPVKEAVAETGQAQLTRSRKQAEARLAIDLSASTILDEARMEVAVILITPGPGNEEDRNLYLPIAVAKSAPIFEGARCYVNHMAESEYDERPERDVRDLVGFFRQCQSDETASRGILCLENSELGRAMLAKIKHAIRYQELFPGSKEVYCGLSVSVIGEGEEGEYNGQIWTMVDTFLEAKSCDIVTRPARGGKFERILSESFKSATKGDSTMAKRIKKKMLKEAQRILSEAVKGADSEDVLLTAKDARSLLAGIKEMHEAAGMPCKGKEDGEEADIDKVGQSEAAEGEEAEEEEGEEAEEEEGEEADGELSAEKKEALEKAEKAAKKLAKAAEKLSKESDRAIGEKYRTVKEAFESQALARANQEKDLTTLRKKVAALEAEQLLTQSEGRARKLLQESKIPAECHGAILHTLIGKDHGEQAEIVKGQEAMFAYLRGNGQIMQESQTAGFPAMAIFGLAPQNGKPQKFSFGEEIYTS